MRLMTFCNLLKKMNINSNISYLLERILYLYFIYIYIFISIVIFISKKIIFHQELKVQILFSSKNNIVKEESQYSSGEKYETYENIQSATTKQST